MRSPRPGTRRSPKLAAGEFGQAHEQLNRAERLAGGCWSDQPAQNAVVAVRHDLEAKQKIAVPKVEALYNALAEGKWPQILAAAEAVLVLFPNIRRPGSRGPRPGSRSPPSARGALPSGPHEGPERPRPLPLRRPDPEPDDCGRLA